MKIHRGTEYIHIDLSGAEARVLLEELENVRGGAKLVKLRQVCEGLEQSLALETIMAPKRMGRPKSVTLLSLPRKRPDIIPQVEHMHGASFEIETTPPWFKGEGSSED